MLANVSLKGIQGEPPLIGCVERVEYGEAVEENRAKIEKQAPGAQVKDSHLHP